MISKLLDRSQIPFAHIYVNQFVVTILMTILHLCFQTIAKSLQQMLAYDGDDFEDVFMNNFRIGYKDVFGSQLTHDLKNNGDQIPVTQANKLVRTNIEHTGIYIPPYFSGCHAFRMRHT
jgi:hypothetical protein